MSSIPSDDGNMIAGIDHVNLVVRDLEMMTTFYRDVLGFRLTKQVTLSGEWIGEVVGLENVLADVVYLEPPHGPRVELIRYRQPEGLHLEGLSLANTLGLRHVAFLVSDMDAAIDRLSRNNNHTFGPVTTVPQTQVSYTGGVSKRLVYFRDPEGNLLELCAYQ